MTLLKTPARQRARLCTSHALKYNCYSLQGKGRLPVIPLLLAALQLYAIIPLLVAVVQTRYLPDPDAQHRIYEDLETSAARIQMPLKQGAFGVFPDDAVRVGTEVGGPVPSCGAFEGNALPTMMPLWKLPDDNTGLTGLVRDMVRVTIHL